MDDPTGELPLPRRRFDDSAESIDRRVTRLEVQMTALASTVDREIQSSSQLHGNISKLIEKLDQNLDLFKDQLTLEREARIEADSREKDARVALATDFRVFTTRVLVALGIVVFIAQFGVTLFGPIIRAAVGLPK